MKKDIFKKIDETEANRAAYLKELETNKAEAEQEQEKAKAEVDTIIKENGGADEYADAKAKIFKADAKAEYYNKKIKDLKASPLYDETEKAHTIEELEKVIQKADAEELKEIYDTVNKAREIAKKYHEKIKRVDTYISKVGGKEPALFDKNMKALNIIRTLDGINTIK